MGVYCQSFFACGYIVIIKSQKRESKKYKLIYSVQRKCFVIYNEIGNILFFGRFIFFFEILSKFTCLACYTKMQSNFKTNQFCLHVLLFSSAIK